MVILHYVRALVSLATLVDIVVEVEMCQVLVWGGPVLVVFYGAPKMVFLGKCELDDATACVESCLLHNSVLEVMDLSF